MIGCAKVRNFELVSGLFAHRVNKAGLLQGNADIKKLLSVRAPVGIVAKSIHKACIGRGISAIKSNENNSQEFLYQWLMFFEPYWKYISQGGTFDAVNSEDIRKLLVPIPKEKEQQKIADCLTSLDDLIRAGEAQLVALKDHKKGLMQQLFPREGETTPRLRFPEFRDAGEWEVKRLGEVAAFHKGKGVSKSDISPDGVLPCIRYGELYTRYLNVINLRPNSLFCRKISSIHHHLKESEMNSVPAVPTTDQAVLPKII